MKLTTSRLILRGLRKSDAVYIAKYVGDPVVAKSLVSAPQPYTLKDAREFLALRMKRPRKHNPEAVYFAIELKSAHQFIGYLGIRNINGFAGTCTLGFWLGRPYHRQGLMSEALAEVLKFIFQKLRLRRVNVTAFTDNKASNVLIKKMGFTHEGRSRASVRDRATGATHDENCYGLLKKDWLRQG